MGLFNKDDKGTEGLSATELLRADHAKVKGLFEEFESAEDESSRANIVNTTLKELIVHDMLEEEIFYPALREVMTEDSEKVDLAGEEHHAAKLLIADLGQIEPSHKSYVARFKVLSEMIKHHIEEEERDLLPAIEKSGADLDALGQRLQERKQELMEQDIDIKRWARQPGEVERRVVAPARSRRNVSRARTTSRKQTRSGGRRASRKTVSRR